jgi:hypothetical protein
MAEFWDKLTGILLPVIKSGPEPDLGIAMKMVLGAN